LAAFFNGYWTTQIIGGFLEHRFGGKIVFGGSVFIGSLLTLLTPTMANLGPGPLIATRVLLGVVQVWLQNNCGCVKIRFTLLRSNFAGFGGSRALRCVPFSYWYNPAKFCNSSLQN